ncbi:energy-coupling factor transporter transmembrane component T family protein [Mycoplasmopsis agalactiae]|uniref:energy-coupling factor transporter transmembrane component T family protein n=1 Tax=Mycoplasmopsis agalactiae TaxID=2110 RepID=UPI001F9D2D32|nr:energy-coupling factor transporter transmembrane component T [Mycoplasmopsis agalactiae]MCE6115364.1 energy-coupling factor transporter transmembrane protein EcfT [Mycoplasmopsis agalactiae]
MNSNYGRYMMNGTVVHKMDPRFKIIFIIIYIVLTFVAKDFVTLGIILLPLWILYLIETKSPTAFLRLWIMPLLIGFFLFWVNIYTMGQKPYDAAGALTENYKKLKDWYPLPIHLGKSYFISWEVIARTLGLVVRVYIMIMATSLMINTTKPMLLSKAIDDLLMPLKLLFIPTHVIVMIIYIALRFIPTLLEEAQRITKAQASRGVDFKNGKFKDKVKSFTTLIIPLFVTAFSKAEDLSNAMETRGYNPYAKRTKYRLIIPTWRDIFLVLIAAWAITYVVLVDKQIIATNNAAWYANTFFAF